MTTATVISEESEICYSFEIDFGAKSYIDIYTTKILSVRCAFNRANRVKRVQLAVRRVGQVYARGQTPTISG